MAYQHNKAPKQGKRRLWLAMLLIGLFFNSTSVRGQNTTLKAFADTVRQSYSDMVFGGIDMSVTGVELIDIPYGLSFARFDRQKGRRQILFNHRWFMKRHWSNDTNAVHRDSIRSVCRDIIHGVLAHEWAHHYMGHTFEKNEVLKERNADILAGRILFENISDEKNQTFFDTKALRRSLLMLEALPGSGTSAYHLSKENRKNLIIKGYMTSWLLANRHEQDKQRLLANLDKELAQELLDTNVATRQRTIRQSNEERSRKFKVDALMITKRLLGERMSDLSDIIRMINHVDTTIKEQSLQIDTLPATADLLSQIIQRKKIDNYNAEVAFEGITALAIENKRIDVTRMRDPDRRSLEAIYNLLFFREGKPLHKKEFEQIPFVKKHLKPYISPDLPLSDTTYYKLQYGDVTFSIDYHRAAIIDSIPKNQLVTVHQGGKKKLISLKKINRPTNNGFLYYFTTGDDTYFIDRYYHLWTETIGAKAIDNKIFLQRYTTKPFTL